MADHTFKCTCGEILVKSHGSSDGYRIRGKITILRGTKMFSICKSCDREVELPMQAALTVPNPKLFIKL